jgi:hypothetical protein
MSVRENRRAIRSLRVGVVPTSHVLQLTVGVGTLQVTIDSEIDDIRAGKQRAIVVSGEWGTGKSNLLSYLREYALKRNVAVSYLNLNGRSAAANHPQRFYHKIVADLRLPGAKGKGLAGVLDIARNVRPQTDSSRWISANLPYSELARALKAFSSGYEYSSTHVISGVDLAWADYGYKRDKAIKRIDDLGGFLKSAGFTGLMIQFDELETIAQLWSVISRRGAYRTLYRLSNLRNIWSIFATTERLNHILDYDRCSSKVSDYEAQKFLDGYFKFPVLRPPSLNLQLGRELAGRIEGLYRSVYSLPANVPLAQVVEKWDRTPFKNPRRLIRHTIDHLDRIRPEPRHL